MASPSSLPSDKVLVTSLALPVRLLSGDHWSRPSLPAPHLLSFVLHHSLAASGSTDTLPSTINYSSASKAVTKVVDSRDWPSLEACAEAAVGELRAMGARGLVEVKLEAQKLLVASRASVEIVSSSEGGPATRSMALSEIVVRCIIGVNPGERVEKQLVHLDVSFPLPASSTEDGFPHKRLAEEAHDHVLPTSFGTIEALAQSLADHLLAVDVAPHPPLAEVTVRVSKPHALTYAKYASVEVTRAQPTGSLQAGASAHRDLDGRATRAVIAVGSNIGDRVGNINRAVDLLVGEAGNGGLHQTTLFQTSWLYESEPMYVEDQARFANGAVLIITTLSPTELLTQLKHVETTIGRTQTFRNGPRVVDLDLVLYGDAVVDVDTPEGGLKVPHISLVEREFVLRPLMDIAPDWLHPALQKPISTLYAALPPSSPPILHRILPFPAPALPLVSIRSRPLIMSILNVTPDSFSDGGSFADVSAVVAAAQKMIANGADILDVGGLSTRPGAAPILPEDEAARVVPVIKALREAGITAPISVDTYRADVARAAVEAGASCINDVYGGRDVGMLAVMAAANVPVVLMHSRGDAAIMTSLTTYDGDDVVAGVVSELAASVDRALAAGVKRWNIILDPGIGFAKNGAQNLTLLASLSQLTKGASPLIDYPLLVGASRKRFIGELTGQTEPKKRGFGTAAVTAACVQSGAVDVVRVHDTRETCDFLSVLAAIWAAGGRVQQ